MKKKIFLFMVLFLVLFCGTVFADSAPMALQYEVKVTNQNGTDIYDYSDKQNSYVKSGKLNYGDKGIISYIEEINNDLYAEFMKEDDVLGYVLFKDLSRTKPWDMSEFDFSNNTEYEENIINKNGVEIYKWPSKLEKVVGKIPYGTKIKCKVTYKEEHWFYVTYNGISGWIYAKDKSTGILEKDYELMTTWKGATILDINDKKIGTIPANTVIQKYYLANNSHHATNTYYLTYNGITGFINTNGKNDDEVVEISNEKTQYTVNSGNEFLIVSEKEKIDIPKGTILEVTEQVQIYNSLAYTNYNGKDGWIIMKDDYDNYYSNSSSSEENNFSSEVSSFDKSSIVENSNDKKEEDKIIINNNKKSGTEIVEICVISAVIIACITTVGIIIINKNKNKKSE